MHSDEASGPDWRDGAAYAPLLGADRSLFAWEWLRRTPPYQAAAECALGGVGVGCGRTMAAMGAEAFGLVAFEAPHIGVPDARPLWRRDVHPYVLEVRAAGSWGTRDDFDLNPLRGIARIHADQSGEHLLLSDGLRCIRLDGRQGAFTSGPACLDYIIAGLVSAETSLLTLGRFLVLARTGRFSCMLHRREPRARRWIMMLRAWDALAAGAGQRDIAEVLFGGSVRQPRWRSREPSIRSQAQRLVGSARRLAAGEYRALLR